MDKSKTEQTLAIIKKKCAQIDHGEWPIKLIVYDGDIVGFDELDRPVIKFRAKKTFRTRREAENRAATERFERG